MSSLFDLAFSYAMIGAGFVVFGTLAHGWLFPYRVPDGSLAGLVVASLALGLVGALMIGVGLNWYRAATGPESPPGRRQL